MSDQYAIDVDYLVETLRTSLSGSYAALEAANVIESLRAQLAAEREAREKAERLQPCGCPESLRIRSVESDYEFCELCDTRSQRDDAVEAEKAWRERAEDAESILRDVGDEHLRLQEDLEKAERERDALQAFKDYVHHRLDKAGIPTHPDGEHSKAGCRIGDRLDIIVRERDALIHDVERHMAIANKAIEDLENEQAKGIHTCHDNCQRPMCVMRRERDEALTRYARLVQTGEYPAEMKALQTDCALLTMQRDDARGIASQQMEACDNLRAELARTWDALTEVDAVLKNDLYKNRVVNALRIIDDARHSDALGEG